REHLEGIGDVLFIELLEPCGEGHRADDGDDRGGIVAGGGHNHGNAKQAADVRAADHGGVQKTRADDHAFQLGQAEPLGGGIGQQDGHEVEEAVAQGVQNVVSSAGAVAGHHAQGNQQGQNALQDTGGRQNAQGGGEHAGDDVDESVEG